jgi:uncharacterized damage-inducible protein DinB
VSVVREWLLAEFDHEMALTRQVLERVPAGAFGWAPHARSAGLGGLATHLASIPHWGSAILEHDGYDLAAADGPKPAEKQTPAEVLDAFDAHVADVRRGLASRTDAELSAPWTLRSGTRTLMSMPRFAALRTFLLSHTIHHRGQMTVYLRLQNVPVPPLYGPSADESM